MCVLIAMVTVCISIEHYWPINLLPQYAGIVNGP